MMLAAESLTHVSRGAVAVPDWLLLMAMGLAALVFIALFVSAIVMWRRHQRRMGR